MLLAETTHAYQSGLARYCRTGVASPIPGIHPEHITEYRRLVLNVVTDMLSNAYPLTRQLLTEAEWDNLVHQFFATHPCQSAQVWLMPAEFRSYIIETRNPLLVRYPQLEDLLLFEWTETEVFLMADQPALTEKTGDILFSRLVINPEHRLLQFSYPVHLEKPEQIKEVQKQDYYVVAHRNREGDVLFTDLSPAICQLLIFLATAPLSLNELFQLFEETFSVRLTTADQQQVIAFFEEAYTSALIAGFKQ